MIFQRPEKSYYEFSDEITSPRLKIRFPNRNDYAAWARLRQRSRSHLQPFEATWPANDLSRTSFMSRLRHYRTSARRDDAYPLFIFATKPGETLLGAITITNVRRGIAQTASLGYWIGEPYANKGFMTEAVEAVAGFSFDQLALHRLEAACLLDNPASARVLEKCRFAHEGIARRYLKINGKWQDHRLFARLKDD